MDTYPAIRCTFQCWNAPTVIAANAFAHLSARGKWIDGKTIGIATEVEEAFIVECPDLKCEVDLDDEWITVIVHGPGEIPPRALVSMAIRADVAHATWLAEVPQKIERRAITQVGEGELL